MGLAAMGDYRRKIQPPASFPLTPTLSHQGRGSLHPRTGGQEEAALEKGRTTSNFKLMHYRKGSALALSDWVWHCCCLRRVPRDQFQTLEEATVMRVGVSVILLLVLLGSGAWAEDGAALETALDLTRADRRLIQSSLAAQGFDPGPADGVFGRRTRAAIGQWQAARGEEPTGYLNAEAAELLLGRSLQTQEATMTGEAAETALGLTRADRRLIQSSLAAAGFEPGPADGVFGRRTRAAIGQWQAARGEESTGYLNAGTAKSLLAPGTKPEREPEVAAEPDVSEQQRQAEAEAEAERQRRERQPGARWRDCETCPDLVVVPSGSFVMGSPESEWGRFNNESPQRRVTITEPFAVGVYEVTFGEWDACVTEGGCNGYQPHGEGWGRGGRPVINVSWDDARAYVTWLSQRTGKRYRLLSESEWEYVARAGTMEPFHTGATISADQANYDSSYTYGSGQKGRYRGRTVQVGTFSPNAFGLHEVHGNVWEWTQDCWNEDYTGAPADSRARESGECEQRVLRGGSWGDVPWLLRSADRGKNEPGTRDPKIGFRIARTLTP